MPEYIGRVILTKGGNLCYRIYEEPVSLSSSGDLESRSEVTHGEIRPSISPVEGHFGIFLLDRLGNMINMLSVAHNETERSDKLYTCAKKYAQEVADACRCVVINRTPKGNADHNQEQERALEQSLIEQKRIVHERHRKSLREMRERGEVGYVSKNPNSAVDLGD